MPMSRYEIRNEYSLADPELYRAAEKDDPEALLEAVAMAGLVGVLRQLGDLAEFAAEIFHDLHEEVMATSARGHGLMIRVQQLESEIPSIEKAFLSQTDHSSFFYSAGVDWRTNLRLDQNLVTKGDLPRFIMDSYEECRGPPRLFLLDKFDVAGAGACLKRYTDPSLFKVETYGMTSADVQREKKIRKTKKKGQRWRNGGTPEVLPSSHAKLHQLFLEECVENGVTNPARRVKLKRRLNGFPFDSRTGKSYMEKVLQQNPSPEHTIREVSMSSSLVVLPTNDHNKSVLEVVEFEPVISPRRDSMGRKISSPIMPPNPSSMYKQNEDFRDDKACKESNSYPSTVSDEISYALDDVNGEKDDMHVGGESKKTEGSFGYESDGVSCEIDNYVDAPSTMGSEEIDTDSELRGKSDFVKIQPSEDFQTRSSSDSQFSNAEPSTMSDEGNNSSKKETTSSFSSSGSLHSNSAENPHPDKLLSARISSAADNDLVDDASSYQKASDGDFSADRHPNLGVPDYTCTSKEDTITSERSSDLEQQLPSSLLCSSDSIPMLSPSDSEEVVREDMTTKAREIDVVAFALNDEDRKKTIIDPLCSPGLLDSGFQPGDDYLMIFLDENVDDDEPNAENLPPHTSTVSEIISHKASSAAMSSDLLHEDDSDHEDLTHVENSASSSNLIKYDDGVPETILTENPGVGKLDDDASSELTEKVLSDCPDIAAANSFVSSSREVSQGEKLTDKLDKGDSNTFTDDSNCVIEASHDKELSSEALLPNTEENHYSSSIDNKVSSENIILPYAENSPPDRPEDAIDGHDSNVVIEESTINESCDVVLGLQGPEVVTGVDLFSKDSAAAVERACSGTPEIIVEPAGLVDNVEDDGINLYTDPIGVEVEDFASADIKSLNDYACEVEQLESADMDSAACTDRNDILTVGPPHKLVEVLHTPEDSDRDDELEDDSNSLSGSQRESGLIIEEVGEGEAAASSDSTSAFCNDVAESQDFVDHTTTEELLQVQRGLDGTAQQSPSHPIDSKSEEIISDETIELQTDQLKEDFLDSQEISLEQSPIYPQQQMPDHDDADHNKEDDNSSGSVFSLVNYTSPPSFFPGNLSYETTNEINLDELPPLPPLPPVQWRMGKLLHAPPVAREEIVNNESLLPNGFTNAISTSHEQMDHSLIQITPEIASKEEKLERELSISFDANAMNETTDLQPEIENESLQEMNHSLIQIDLENAPHGDKVENALNSEKVEHVDVSTMDERIELQPDMDNEQQKQQHSTASPDDVISSSHEETNHSSAHINLDTASEQKKVQPSSSSSVASAVPETKIIPPKVENEQLKLLFPFKARELPGPAEEDGVSNGTRLKVARPPNPLFEDVAALDKSKLRKVTERVRPQIQKVDERDSLLEQIRTKSFNLKPASASRPSIRGPRTNLKVAAILEKANQIRQALAGSDEDDEDNWSDS